MGLVLTACAPSNATHVPNPLLLPFYGASSAIENTRFDARRTKVKTYVTENYPTLLAEISTQTGPTLETAFTLARVPPSKWKSVKSRLKTDYSIVSKSVENLVVSLMVNGN